MSVRAIAWALEQRVGSPAGKMVLICLANYSDENGQCWPSQQAIMEETELSERSVRDWLAKLEAAGLVERRQRRRRDGSRTSDAYQLRLSQASGFRNSEAGTNRQEVPADQPAKSAGMGETNRQEVPLLPAGGAGLTSFEPSQEPSLKKDLSETPVSDTSQPKPAKKRNDYPADFEEAWRGYPTSANMSKAEAFGEWRKLDADDRALVMVSLAPFKAWCAKKPDYDPPHMCRYLKWRRFEGHAKAAKPASPVAIVEDEKCWRSRLDFGRPRDQWFAHWGPMPGQPGCRVPPHLLEPSDGKDWTVAA